MDNSMPNDARKIAEAVFNIIECHESSQVGDITDSVAEYLAPYLLDERKLAEWLVENRPTLFAKQKYEPSKGYYLTAAIHEFQERKE